MNLRNIYPFSHVKEWEKKKKNKDKIFYCPLIVQNSRNVHQQLFSGWETFQNKKLPGFPGC